MSASGPSGPLVQMIDYLLCKSEWVRFYVVVKNDQFVCIGAQHHAVFQVFKS